MKKKKIEIIEGDDLFKIVTVVTKKGKDLVIQSTWFERESREDEWFESCGSTNSLPIRELKDFLTNL